jgi:two-component system, OmpR family, sensor histidine kinase ChvG
MAIETDGKRTAKDLVTTVVGRARSGAAGARQIAGGVFDFIAASYQRAGAIVGPIFRPMAKFWRTTWVMRLIGRTLLGRIIASNLLGLLILLGGLTYLIQFNSWLIDAKIEHLRAQSHILAAAIASKATLPEAETPADGQVARPYDSVRDDPFAALEFSIKPEVVVPLLPSLLEQTNNRARVYDTGGVLIADSSKILRPGSIIPIKPGGILTGRKPRTENNWTRITQWLMRSDLRVYKDIGQANGRFYPEVRAALKGETTELMMLAKKRREVVSVATPIIRGNEVRGVLLLSTAPGEIDDVQQDELFAVLVVVLGAAAATLLASFLLARTVAEPMRQLSQYANEVTRDISAVKDLPRFDDRADEVGQLARSFTLMTRALYRRIEASEKFAADVAHELKNPLTAARSTAESLIYVKTDKQRDEFIEQIQLELKRLNKLISDVADASRLDADLALQPFQKIQLKTIVNDLVETFQDLPASEGRHVAIDIESGLQVSAFDILGQDGRIEQVLTNLLANALSFTPPDGTVTVKLRRGPHNIDMIVEDQGPGIDQENIEKIFTRFYTYRPTANASRGDNSGLGLSISREIVEAHDGRLWAENIWPDAQKGGAGDATPAGARFIMRLPAANVAAAKHGRLSGGR